MNATIEVPDELYREVKARSALEGRTVREVTVSLYNDWLGRTEAVVNGDDDALIVERRKRFESLVGIWKERGTTEELMKITRSDD